MYIYAFSSQHSVLRVLLFMCVPIGVNVYAASSRQDIIIIECNAF